MDSARLKPISTEGLRLKQHQRSNISHFLRNAQGVASHYGRLPESLRVVVISDTHGKHRGVLPPPGDTLVHGGDFSNIGEPEQVSDLAEWLGTLPHKVQNLCVFEHPQLFSVFRLFLSRLVLMVFVFVSGRLFVLSALLVLSYLA